MSETQACEVPIVELAAAVPEILVAKWIDGEYSSHSAPVGKYIHHLLRDLAAERERADRLIAFLADDALAITYQSLAQYRQAAIDAARRK